MVCQQHLLKKLFLNQAKSRLKIICFIVNDDWWKGTVSGKSGIFPQNHVKKIA